MQYCVTVSISYAWVSSQNALILTSKGIMGILFLDKNGILYTQEKLEILESENMKKETFSCTDFLHRLEKQLAIWAKLICIQLNNKSTCCIMPSSSKSSDALLIIVKEK